MLQKICALILLFSLGLLQVPSMYAYETAVPVNASSLSGGEMKQIDTLLAGFSQEKLKEIQGRLDASKNKRSSLSRKNQDLLSYIEQQVSEKLGNKVWGDILKSSISDKDKAFAEKEILEMQKQFGNSLKGMLSQLIVSWEELSSFEEKGNISMNFNLDVPNIINAKGGASLKNYTAKTQKFNSQLEGRIEAFMQASSRGEEVDVEFKSLIDYISHDGNMYLLLEQLSLSSKNKDDNLIEKLQPYIERFKQLAKQDTYISFLDQDAQMVLSVLQGYSPENFAAQIDSISSKALLEAYAKEDGKYLLKPSKAFCDLGKELTHRFDPFNGKSCSEKQYDNMLQEFAESGIRISLTPGANKLLNISFNHKDVEGDINVAWSSVGIININADIFDPEKKDLRHIQLDFTPKSKLVLSMLIDDFSSQLDISFSRKANITQLMFSADVQERMNINAQYKNGSLTSHFSLNEYGTDISCKLHGELQKKYANLKGECNVVSASIGYMFPEEDTMNIEANILVDMRSTKNNLNLNYDMSVGENELFHLDIENTGTRKYSKNIHVQAPKKTKAFSIIQEEVFEEKYGDLYQDDYNYDYDIEDESYDYDGYGYDEDYTDELTGINYFCNEYRYDEQANYDYCEQYLPEDEFYAQYGEIEETTIDEQ